MPGPEYNPNTRPDYRDKKNYSDHLSQKNYNWHYFQNKDRRRELHDRYKLHVSIDPKVFPEVEDQIHDILRRGMKDGSIITYKTFDVMRNRKEELSRDELRQQNNPFVIYLNDNQATNPDYLAGVTKVCKQIENVLSNTKPGKHQAVSDLPLSPHIIFRQALLNGEVNPVRGKAPYKPAHGNDAETLRDQGKESVPYQVLTQNLRDYKPVEELVSAFTAEEADRRARLKAQLFELSGSKSGRQPSYDPKLIEELLKLPPLTKQNLQASLNEANQKLYEANQKALAEQENEQLNDQGEEAVADFTDEEGELVAAFTDEEEEEESVANFADEEEEEESDADFADDEEEEEFVADSTDEEEEEESVADSTDEEEEVDRPAQLKTAQLLELRHSKPGRHPSSDPKPMEDLLKSLPLTKQNLQAAINESHQKLNEATPKVSPEQEKDNVSHNGRSI
jgi:hypothetical protein